MASTTADDYDGHDYLAFTRDHAEIPIFVIAVYLTFVFKAPVWVDRFAPPTGFHLKGALIVWNLSLFMFSTVGAMRVVPTLFWALREEGFDYTVCTDPAQWFLHGKCGLWVVLFIYSKIPELLDTVFLVLRKREVIFLHWFHHFTVLLYCWHAFHTQIGVGLWFAAINYCVHSAMYLYYFLSSVGYNREIASLASYITTIQVLQMIGGIGLLLYAARAQTGDACYVDPANLKLGIAMYLSYFLLFTLLFYSKYIQKNQ